ncbi:hypothetical protein A9Q99_09030 [Gammaproteobacteria bacterium 45_16_T64]|nr:hypothetical protein A9Q99_09030 [Gammaproteobacteria bacterium 45_16_T64]
MSEERFQDLEMKVSFLDDAVNSLNQTVTYQQLQIEELKKQLRHSHKQLIQLKDSTKIQDEHEPPPHY